MPIEDKKPQHMRALEKGNRIRLARAHLKREVNAGRRSVTDVLAHSPEEALTMPIVELLMAQRGWGHRRASRILHPLLIHEKRQVGDLTSRQSRHLCKALEDPPSARLVAV